MSGEELSSSACWLLGCVLFFTTTYTGNGDVHQDYQYDLFFRLEAADHVLQDSLSSNSHVLLK